MPRLDATDIITQATMATTLVKMLVDLIKMCWGGEHGRPPTWVPPLAALASGIAVLMLLALALDQDLTQSRVLASTVLAGLMAAVGAIGVTELHRMARTPAITPPLPLSPIGGYKPNETGPAAWNRSPEPAPLPGAMNAAPSPGGQAGAWRT